MPEYKSFNERAELAKEIQNEENKERKRESFAQYEVLQGRLTPYVKGYLKRFYASDTIEEIPVISSVNLCKRIIESEASLYKKPPKREFEGVTEEQAKVLEQIYKDMSFDSKMQRINIFYKLQNQVHAQVTMRNGKLVLRPLMKHHLDAIPNDEWPETADGYAISSYDRAEINYSLKASQDGVNQRIADVDDFRNKLKIAVWTPESNFIMDGKGNQLSEDDKNELGLVPIIDIFTHKDFEYWVRQDQTTVDFCVQFNAALSDLSQIVRMQGFSVAYLIAEEGVIPKNLKIGPNFLLTLPVNPTSGVTPQFGYANPNADIAGGISYVESLVSAFLTSKGLDPSLVSTTGKSEKFTSGLDRLLSMVDRFEASKMDADKFISAEKQIFKIIIRYLNTYGGTEFLDYNIGKINEEKANVNIKFSEPEMIQSESEKLSMIEKKIELGLMSRLEAIKEDRGGLTDEAAIKVMKQIEAEQMLIEDDSEEEQIEQ